MIVKTDPGPLFTHATDAFYAAAEDTLEVARSTAPRLTGQYAASMKMWRRKRSSGPTARIGSKLVYARPLERGAWSKGAGPHIRQANAPGTLKLAGETFNDAYPRRLRGSAIRGSAFASAGLDLGSGL